jgi:hypothetical protein
METLMSDESRSAWEQARRRRLEEQEATSDRANKVQFNALGADVDGRLITWEEVTAFLAAAAAKFSGGSKANGDLTQAAFSYLPKLRSRQNPVES